MKTTHVSDYDIQKFTFDLSECDAGIIKHIHSCRECKKRAENYLSLSHTIKNQPEPILEFNLTELVLDKLPLSSKKESDYTYFIYFLIMISIGVVVSSLYYFKGVFIDLFSNTNTTAISTSFMVSVALLIIVALSLDLVRSFNKKINMLNY